MADDALGFFGPRGLEGARLNRIPVRGAGLSNPPYDGDRAAWLADVALGVRAAIQAVHEARQTAPPDLPRVADRCRAAALAVKDAAEREAGPLAFRRAKVDYAAGLIEDLLANPTPRLLDRLPVVESHLLDARDEGEAAGAAETIQALDALTADLRRLVREARREGYGARADDPAAVSAPIDTAAAVATPDAAGLRREVDDLRATAQGLAAEAETGPPAGRAAVRDYAERLGAQSRMARATIDAPMVDTADMEAVAEDLAETGRAGAALPGHLLSPRAQVLVRRAGRVIARATGWVTRLIARALGRPVPPPPGDDLDEPVPPTGGARAWDPVSGPTDLLAPGAIWRQPVPDVDPAGWPTMVTLPPGRFWMGSPRSEAERRNSEGPRHEVSIAYPLALGRDPVSVGAFAAFIARTGHDMGASARIWTGEKWEDTPGKGWGDPGFAQTGEHPVTCVSWEDATAYVGWLNEALGLIGQRDAYRLPSEAEWEYACRAGTTTPFSFGETISTTQANFNGNFAYGRGRKTGHWRKATTPAEAFPVNAFGLRDMHGNVFEWCQDEWRDSYGGAPTDGSAWLAGNASLRVVRGGSWFISPRYLRSAYRGRDNPSDRLNGIGFRLARTLSPPTS